ncbi:MAG: metallophosphoesterase [Nanoarchaeota archaeon]|nr:metallophosphoesterase [Nanoarchaeota archaeon]
MELEYLPMLVEGKDITQNEILFISDIEHFDQKINTYLLDRIKKESYKAVVLVGDILSGLGTFHPAYKIFQESNTAFNLFFDVKKLMKKYLKKGIEVYDVERFCVGSVVSDNFSESYSKELKNFKKFIKRCHKEKIPVVFFSGNHDSLLSPGNAYETRFIPLIEEIRSLKGLIIPGDLELIKLGKDLYLMGVHTEDDDIKEHEFHKIKNILKEIEAIKNPENIIFVSHIPGIKKFSKLGSHDITNLKKRYKFKYHYHGHCKNYYGEYDEEGVPTKSIHIEDGLVS